MTMPKTTETRCRDGTRHAQQASNVKDRLPDDMKRHAEVASEKGASSWLPVLPIGEHGFHQSYIKANPGMLYV